MEENDLDEEFNVELRCVRLYEKNRYEITWPNDCTIKFNNHKVAEYTHLAKNSSLKKRYDDEILIDKKFVK